MNTDGNLAALNAYQKEQDQLQAHDDYIETMQQELADDLYDAYLSGNQDVIDEVDDSLTDTITTDNMIRTLREAMTAESNQTVINRGHHVHAAYQRFLGEVCESLAKRYTTEEELDRARMDFL